VDLLAMPAREARKMRGKTIALVPQSPMTALNAAVSLRAHFDEAWRAHERTGRKALEARLKPLMREVQLPAEDDCFLRRKPGQISVGQAQRVLIALALLHRPSILIADEPTSALDPVTQAEIIRLLQQLNRRNGTALLYISHDLMSVLQLCGRLAILHAGAIAECLPVAGIEQARHPATLSLLRALPVPASVLLSHFSTHADANAQARMPEMECSESAPGKLSGEIQDASPMSLSHLETLCTQGEQRSCAELH
jgi:ABC-type glutathione transport system ATPase component